MHLTKWLLLFSLQLSSTNCESETETPSAAVSWIHTSTVSFYLELISLVFGSCDLSGEKTADIELACAHLTNATSALRTFLTPLADVLPTKSQVDLLQRKIIQFGTKGLDGNKGPTAPKVYQKIPNPPNSNKSSFYPNISSLLPTPRVFCHSYMMCLSI